MSTNTKASIPVNTATHCNTLQHTAINDQVMTINAIAPFALNSRLLPLMLGVGEGTPREPKFIINVSAMEGKFYRFKTPHHPHTNMAKVTKTLNPKL